MRRAIVIPGTIVALASLLLIPATAGAATDSMTVTGTVAQSMSVDAPATFALPALATGTTVTSSPMTVTITTNTGGWSLTVADTSANHDPKDGKLSKTDATSLATPLEVAGGEASSTSLATSVTLKNATGVAGTTALNNIVFKQVVATNAVSGDYSITLTFTATPGS